MHLHTLDESDMHNEYENMASSHTIEYNYITI